MREASEKIKSLSENQVQDGRLAPGAFSFWDMYTNQETFCSKYASTKEYPCAGVKTKCKQAAKKRKHMEEEEEEEDAVQLDVAKDEL